MSRKDNLLGAFDFAGNNAGTSPHADDLSRASEPQAKASVVEKNEEIKHI